MEAAFSKIKDMGVDVAAGVFNVGGRFIRKPFLELTLEEFESGYDANGYVPPRSSPHRASRTKVAPGN